MYKIGAVSNITGLTTHLIRSWERRHDFKIAQRSEGGTRLYSDQDIVRLSLIRDLLKRGDAIGEVAGLSEEALRKRLKNYAPIAGYKTRAKFDKESAKETKFNESSHGSKRSFSDAQLMRLSQISTEIDCDYLKNISFILFEINNLENQFNHLSCISEEVQAFYLDLYQQMAKTRALLESMLAAVCSHENLEGLYHESYTITNNTGHR